MKTRLSGAVLGLALLCGSAQAQDKRPIVFAWSPAAETPQIAQAIEMDAWGQAGLDIKFVSFPTGRESLEAIIGGQVDFAAMTEFAVATGALRNQRFGVVATV